MKKVLVIDDTKNIRTLLTKCLEIEGYEVETASDGNQALELFLTNNYSLAFIDIKLPFISGTEVLKKIRESGINTPVIVITAYASVKNAIECTHMGAVAYLQKPFTADKVRSVLKELDTANCLEASTDFFENARNLIDEARFSEAFGILKKALSEQPLNKEVYSLLSKACEGMGKNEESQRYMDIFSTLNK